LLLWEYINRICVAVYILCVYGYDSSWGVHYYSCTLQFYFSLSQVLRRWVFGLLELGRSNEAEGKTRGLAQHGGSPGWLEESDPAGVILLVMEGCTACHFRTVPVA
jgi:hypothetical protein